MVLCQVLQDAAACAVAFTALKPDCVSACLLHEQSIVVVVVVVVVFTYLAEPAKGVLRLWERHLSDSVAAMAQLIINCCLHIIHAACQ
jgi:hypothetical protein